jgi:hypothetical protein
MKMKEESGFFTKEEIRIVKIYMRFMAFTGLMILILAFSALYKFGVAPNEKDILLDYITSLKNDLDMPQAAISALCYQLNEAIRYYHGALRISLWSLIGSAVCLMSSCYYLRYFLIKIKEHSNVDASKKS